jgi:ABC-type multidrug transport system ATPase subunit
MDETKARCATATRFETTGLTKRFGDRTAVERVNLLVPAGTAFGYLGRTARARQR